MLDDSEPDDVPFERPSTADGGSDEDRPFTRAQGNLKKQGETSPVPPRPATSMVTEGDVIVFKGKSLQLNFTDTWGDLHYLGLTGLEILGKDGEALPVSLDMMQASPSDLHHLPGHESDDRTLDKVINGNNVTCSDENMWLIPFNEGQNHELTITFSQALMMAGLRVWNYNKSPEDTYRGAKTVHVQIDGKQVSPPDGYLIRKGPGNCYFDFAQEIVFAGQQKPPIPPTSETKMDSSVRSSVTDDGEYESVQMPCGFIYQLHLISTWGDPYYVGLNGIEIYDASHNKIELTETNIAAYPDSVNVLANIQNDVRTPDRLIDGVNSTNDGRHMWLAPILPTTLNRVYVIFDQPTAVSMIKIWNYSKTANRGAKDIALLVDDLLVYNGMLQPVRAGAKGIVPNCDTPQSYHTILFTDNKDIIRKEKHSIISNQAGEQDIQLTNDKIVVGQYSDPKKAQQGKPVNQVTSLGFVTNDAIGKYEYNYSVNREKVHQQERDFAGYPTDYTEDEQIVQNYLEYLKWMEFQKTKDDFYPARPIKLHLSDIKASEIYRVLKKFPKGGNLHLHHNHVVSKSTILDFIYKNPYLLDNFYVRESPEPNKWRFNFYLNPPTGWVKVKDNPKYTKDVIIEHSTFLGVIDDKALSSPTISGLRWKEMNPLFSTLGSAIVNQINVSRFHMEAMFQSAIDECTLWMHIRKQRVSHIRIYV
uniref:KATNIP domain-containing protein n=1 Tax=Magallana gigas TaxID=29159 RepID=K1QNE3_MAGGI